MYQQQSFVLLTYVERRFYISTNVSKIFEYLEDICE